MRSNKKENVSVRIHKVMNGYSVHVSWEEGKGEDIDFKNETWFYETLNAAFDKAKMALKEKLS